ncbi:MAG: hypothetical protein CVV41_19695 [Candidatus Riflebacteria bacterium HGW-Riflebacteria-1]|nr:MAG: hypothetical protein CVV41_19695 [Candidatus Riflebacteria bacterium HGW-Riflebacteria-1]
MIGFFCVERGANLRLEGDRFTYSRAIIRIARYFDRCPGNLGKQDLKDYFDHFITVRFWSTVRADRGGLQFFWK